ncbi:unnamed protein product [Moneuplotes crassus]|uniref:Glycoside hydrolase family 38 central domain-containing protein n=2 Tax=Euplotes crassus TaxID=5936 RepID=A0AAD1XPJ3_EUPCR|nr:unnamed protein product [Moneuplotes crassus]
MKIIIGFLLCSILALSLAGVTWDTDLEHGHEKRAYGKYSSDGSDKLMIHVIAHTHDDVGWKKTPDEYYAGTKQWVQKAGIRYILDTLYSELMKDPAKKFTYVEMAYFQKWWNEQTDEVKANVQVLVDEGRLAFANAGMSMSDEATVHYEDFLNNLKAGHDFLKRELGYRPTIGWHLDPFGHHSATAGLFAEMGFNAWFFARIDHQDKDKRLENKEMEWLHRPFNKSLGARAEIFTHMMYHHYSSPEGFHFNDGNGDDPIVDDPRLETYNIEEKVSGLRDYLLHMADHYRTNHLLVPFGDDFNFENSKRYFMNIDKLIKGFNAKYDDIEMFYSTPEEYIKAVNEIDIELPTKYDDLFPYSDFDDAYWTGYFTSRPTLKGFVREVSRDMNSESIFLAMDYLMNGKETFTVFEELFNQMGVLQHHDAVSGTETQHVANNYFMNLDNHHESVKTLFQDSFESVLKTGVENIGMCRAHNSTFADCPTKRLLQEDTNEIVLTIFNPSNSRKTIAKIPVPNGKLKIYDSDSKELDVDIICSGQDQGCFAYLPVSFDMFSAKQFTLKKIAEDLKLIPQRKDLTMFTNKMEISLKNLDDFATLVITREGKNSHQVKLGYEFYNSFSLPFGGPISGAYIFRPLFADDKPHSYNTFTDSDIYKGKVVSLLKLYGDEVDSTILTHDFTDFIEIESYVKGIPNTWIGKEVILKLAVDDIKNNGVFYTDSMGLEMQERKLDYRPTWNLQTHQRVSSNYYPINHGITIKDERMTFEVLNDRSQGGSSLENGEIEIMLHRRIFADDSRGVNEELNEYLQNSPDNIGIPVKTHHYMRLYENDEDLFIEDNSRIMQKNIDVPLTYLFGTKSTPSLNTLKLTQLSEVLDLPPQIKAVFLPEHDGTLFLRLENILDLFSASDSAIVDVEALAAHLGLFMGLRVESVVEVSNTGLYSMAEMQEVKLHWKGEDYTSKPVSYESDPSKVELEPQRIRSFRLTFT